ncbi:MAG: CYTH domain-containing protein [Bacilli bacterium]
MQKSREFRSILTIEEYQFLMKQFTDSKSDIQTNHYFDTSRFSLKAQDILLKVKERDGQLEMFLKLKKGYQMAEFTHPITHKELDEIIKTGIIPFPEIVSELSNIIKEQKMMNFLSLSTKRNFLSYGSGALFIDESRYCYPTIIEDGKIIVVIDHEIEYDAKSYEQGINEFINLIKDYNIVYKKADKKIKRAFNIYKKIH